MNKKEFAAELATTAKITKADAEFITDNFLTTLTKVLATGESVKFVGFGSFETKLRAARNGVNPDTGEHIQIPEKVVVKFKPGKSLKEAL